MIPSTGHFKQGSKRKSLSREDLEPLFPEARRKRTLGKHLFVLWTSWWYNCNILYKLLERVAAWH
jgi:hypothetical protein